MTLIDELEAIYRRCNNWPETTSDGFMALLELRNTVHDKVLPALRSLPTDDGWEDIAINPPPANEVVLMCWYHGHWEVWEYEAGCYETGQRIGGYSNVHLHGQATHWRPLPAPPAC